MTVNHRPLAGHPGAFVITRNGLPIAIEVRNPARPVRAFIPVAQIDDYLHAAKRIPHLAYLTPILRAYAR